MAQFSLERRRHCFSGWYSKIALIQRQICKARLSPAEKLKGHLEEMIQFAQ